ncbi:DUF2975 domain-containing protein [uncultured Flavobacterium sp.]|uniref:DUF2975 domain-containing protein n=1 Tax=uncultured Flavobacterium sp. TaxID=165435 RepID=UPI00260083CF|nr:DUF2975 domain-containing protein [uncultured Flavobacterium sp.]
MKRNLKIIIGTLCVLMLVAALYFCVIIGALFDIEIEGQGTLTDFVMSDFTRYKVASKAAVFVFLVLYAVTTGYLVYVLWYFVNVLYKIHKGYTFYQDQSKGFKKSGSSIIIYGKSKFLLFLIFWAFFFYNPFVFVGGLVSYLTIYIIGKFLLVLSVMIEKGEVLKQEVDLTV